MIRRQFRLPLSILQPPFQVVSHFRCAQHRPASPGHQKPTSKDEGILRSQAPSANSKVATGSACKNKIIQSDGIRGHQHTLTHSPSRSKSPQPRSGYQMVLSGTPTSSLKLQRLLHLLSLNHLIVRVAFLLNLAQSLTKHGLTFDEATVLPPGPLLTLIFTWTTIHDFSVLYYSTCSCCVALAYKRGGKTSCTHASTWYMISIDI